MSGTDTHGPEWHWDGSQWLWWDGQEWLPAGVGASAAVPAPPTATPPTIAAPPPAAGPPTLPGPAAPPPRRGLGAGGITAIVLGIVLALVVIAGGLTFVLTRDGDEADTADSGVVTLQTEPISTAVAAFTPPAGTDTPVTSPPKVSGVQTIPADTVGLFGGTLDTASCDKAKLVAFLQQNPDKAAAWAQTLGITVAGIPAFVEPLTPIILRSDTAVTNHGFENGRITTMPAILQAGTAVLVNSYGQPVVKCYCGNPLTPAPAQMSRVKYTGPTWPTFQPGTMTVIQPTTVVINQYVLVDVVNNVTFVRPASSDGSQDTPQDTTAEPTTPAPVTPTPVTPAPTVPAPVVPEPTTPAPTTVPPAAESGRGGTAITLVQDRYRSCSAAIGDNTGDVESVIGAADFQSTPTGAAGEYEVTVTDESGTFVYLVNVDTGSVAATSADAVEVAGYCPGVFD
ncbi:MAG: hypothetical protein QG597_3138 [Actinomycetota bacterium]|nr:hypothetical protein [Actinomycetota bacterium]